MDFQPGLERINEYSQRLGQDVLATVKSFEEAQGFDQRPWFIAGCSDGIGLQTAIAAIDAGLMKYALGVYWEPAHFLELGEDGKPVSPVHYARLQNALALKHYAESKGVQFELLQANLVLTPPRGLKGDRKEGATLAPLPTEVVEAFERLRSAAPQSDAVFINSVAFGKWMCPREGKDAITVPTIDFEGRLVEGTTKKFHPRGYEETLDTMGRNHLALLDSIKSQGWLGAGSLTAFFTWAGGSQNVNSLQGVYGFGALGDAKIIAEADTARFRLDHPVDEFGVHAIVRLPAFLSAALMGIPGGGLFGLLSQRVLESHGVFDDMPTLATKMIRLMFGPEWVRENPISQIELDHAECLYIDEINASVAAAHERIAEFRTKNGLTNGEPISASDSRALLDGLAPAGFAQLLRRFTPQIESNAVNLTLNADQLRAGVGQHLAASQAFKSLALGFEEIELMPAFSELSGEAPISITAEISRDGTEALITLTHEESVVGRGRVEFRQSLDEINVVGEQLGEAKRRLDTANWLLDASSLMNTAQGWNIQFGPAPSIDDELLAYQNNGRITVINHNAKAVAELKVR